MPLRLPTIAILLLTTLAFAADDKPAEPAPIGLGLPLPIIKLTEHTVTVKTTPTDRTPAKEITLKLDPEKTRVSVGVVTKQEEDGNRTTTSYKFEAGKLADLKVAQRIKVMALDDLATQIMIIPMPQKPAK